MATSVRKRGMYATVQRDGELDEVAVEEPLEIRVDGAPLTVTMRTPGHDEELAAGLLYTEGLLSRAPAVGLGAELEANTVEVAGPLDARPPARPFYSSSACGVCGKGALEELAVACPRLPEGPVAARALLAGLPDRMRQPTFERTGGLHAAALFSLGGELELLREDVGRHNTVDKVGRCLLDGTLPLSERVMCVSGRLSFELVSKTVRAGARLLVGVGPRSRSPSSSRAIVTSRSPGLPAAGA